MRLLRNLGNIRIEAKPTKKSNILGWSRWEYREETNWSSTYIAVGELPVRYLGLPFIAFRLTFKDCQPIFVKT